MIITLTGALVRDLAADLEGRAKVYWADGQVDKGAAIDAALEWVNGVAAAVRWLNGELEAVVPAAHQAEIRLSLDNLAELAAGLRKLDSRA
jgi:hypothetical protein